MILPSARKHGVSDDDIRHAYAHPIASAAVVLYEIGVYECDECPVWCMR